MTKKRFWVPLCLMVLVASLGAQAVSYITFEQVTIAGSSIGFTDAKVASGGGHVGATLASCRVETAEVRYTVDGTTPTSTVGVPLEPGDLIDVTGNDLIRSFRAIRTTATSGQLSCHYSAP
jgi:hypothetical protein